MEWDMSALSESVEDVLALESELSELSMTDLIGLQDRLSEELYRRYGRHLALAFTDIVDSTAYSMRFGDVAGQALQQRHLTLVERSVANANGCVVDTAGDGCFLCFQEVEQAARALIALQRAVAEQNASRSGGAQLSVRCAIHWGEVLTDGLLVRGRAVNLCARLVSSTGGGQICITSEAYYKLSPAKQLGCRSLSPLALKGCPNPVEALVLEWRARNAKATVTLAKKIDPVRSLSLGESVPSLSAPHQSYH